MKRKCIAIIGPTSSGKSDIAISLAREFNGEIISADSRQVYKGMNIGSGKVTKKEQQLAKHWMLDVVSPKTDYNVGKFLKKARRVMDDIWKRGKVPIICGGTGFWVQALIEGQDFPNVPADQGLRKKLSKLKAKELFERLHRHDPRRAHNIDPHNKVRLIRSIEIATALGKVPEQTTTSPTFNSLVIALDPGKDVISKKIEKRLDQRLREGMVEEVKQLHIQGVSWKRLDEFGLEYRWISRFLRSLVNYDEMRHSLLQDIKHYAKRQITWIRRWQRQGRTIHFHTDPRSIQSLVKKFLEA